MGTVEVSEGFGGAGEVSFEEGGGLEDAIEVSTEKIDDLEERKVFKSDSVGEMVVKGKLEKGSFARGSGAGGKVCGGFEEVAVGVGRLVFNVGGING